MKKRITKIWGVALVVAVLASLLMIAAPASAADPLKWNDEVLPSGANIILSAGSDVFDFAVAGDTTTVYAVGRVGTAAELVTATITTALSTNATAQAFRFYYINQDGVSNNGTISFSDNYTGLTATVTLTAGDTGVLDITSVVSIATATSGAFSITSSTSTTVMGTFTITAAAAGTFTDSSALRDDNVIWKSVNAGNTWVNYSTMTGFPGATAGSGFRTMYVAVAPDDPNYVVVADSTNASGQVAYVSTNGGSNWSSLGLTTAVTAYNVAISSTVPPGVRYVALPGTTAAGVEAIYYYNLGAAAPTWQNACDTAATAFNGSPNWGTLPASANVTGVDHFRDIAFSPNFSADYTAAALSVNTGAAGQGIQLHILSFNLKNWDQPANYPATVKASAGAFVVSQARVTTAPDYVGSDDVSRVTFTALAATDGGTEVGGLFRNNDSNPVKVLMSSATAMNSVAFDGTTLVAGAYGSNIVYKCTDALASIPTVVPSRTNKRIGIDDVTSTDTNDQTLVAFSGTNVLGAKRGVQSAFAISKDGGTSWNDISLIDTINTNITDLYVTPDSAKVFFTVNNAAQTSLFRWTAGTWVRVLTVNDANGYILRGAPETADAIYVVDNAGTSIYYASDAGENRWYAYVASGAVTDMAVESKSVVYIASGATVRKSSNSGFTWGSPVTAELSGDTAVATIVSLGTDKLLVGGNAGHVSWSTDGNKTWVKQPKAIVSGYAGNAYATATGLGTTANVTDYIFASGSTASTSVYRWTVGDPPSADWKELGTAPAGYGANGIAYTGGVLYITSNDGTNTSVGRCLNATAPGGWEFSTMADAGKLANTAPSDLKVSLDGTNNKVWYVNTSGSDGVRSYIDALVVGPKLTAPTDKFQNPMNPVTGRSQDIAFQWPRPVDGVTGYQLRIYTDAAGMNIISTVSGGNPGPFQTLMIGPFQPTSGTTFFEWMPGQTYYWRVRVSATGPIYSAWSEMRTLTIMPGAAMVPGISSPINGATITSATPAFSWTPVSGTTTYRFQLAETTSFAAPLVDSQLAQTGIQPAVKLDAGKTYFWRVKAVVPVEGDWSTISNLTVAEPAPAPTPPVVIQQAPAPIINLPPITMPPAVVNLPPAEPAAQPISAGLLWAVIIIGAVLVIALIVLIVRTRRTV